MVFKGSSIIRDISELVLDSYHQHFINMGFLLGGPIQRCQAEGINNLCFVTQISNWEELILGRADIGNSCHY